MIKKITVFSFTCLSIFTFSQNTERRDDAGAPTTKSGFYETVNPINYPSVASESTALPKWWHLLDVRHSNPGNNYGMQFSGNFFDQNLWFRKTSDNPQQPWSKILLQGPDGNVKIESKNNPFIQLSNEMGSLQIARSSCNGCYGGQLGDTVFRNTGDSHNIVFAINNNTHNGKSYIGIRDSDKFYVKFSNDYTSTFEGKIKAKEIEVKTDVWADYVFQKEYQLTPLSEVETQIVEHGHLQGIPSSSEVIKNGINLGQMNVKLLEKVEELTLYLIAQKKEIDALKAKIENTTSN